MNVRADPSPPRKRKHEDSAVVGVNREDESDGLLPSALDMTEEAVDQKNEPTGEEKDEAADMAVKEGASGVKRMRESADAGRAMDGEPTVGMMTEMDQQAVDEEVEPISAGESDDEAAAEEYASSMSADKHATGVGVMGEDPARHEEHKGTEADDEHKGTEAEVDDMAGGKAADMAAEESVNARA